MTMVHKAFGFDWVAFRREALPAIEQYLEGDPKSLKVYAQINASRMVDPDEQEPLDSDRVEEAINEEDADFLAEATLTLFYDPRVDAGLGHRYLEIDRELADQGAQFEGLLIGRPLRRGAAVFDPGKMGTYFCDADEAQQKLKLARSLPRSPMRKAIEQFAAEGVSRGGLYITF